MSHKPYSKTINTIVMKHSFFLILLFILIFLKDANAKNFSSIPQDSIKRNGLVFFINQPLGFINKVRLKAGYRFENKRTFLVVFSQFNNNAPLVKFNGIQICGEYQQVFHEGKKEDLYFYGKAGFGNYEFSGETFNFFVGYTSIISGSGEYVFLGGGIGQELFLNKSKSIFLQINEGLKFSKVLKEAGDDQKYRLLLPWNPGSLIDININFGFKF